MVAAMTSCATADDATGSYWMKKCSEAAPKNAKCLGYLNAIRDMNQMLTEVFEQPLWCAPKAVTVGQLRHVILSELGAAPPARLSQPFAGLATLALKSRFPCPAKA